MEIQINKIGNTNTSIILIEYRFQFIAKLPSSIKMLVCREVIQPSIILILMEIQTLPLSRQIGPMKIHTNNETNIGHNPDMILFNENHLFCNLNKYIKQFGQIYLSIWTNIFVNLDKYIRQFGQIF